MTAQDQKLIDQAYRLTDYQEVDKLLSQAESQEAIDQIHLRSSYLYHKEEAFAGCL